MEMTFNPLWAIIPILLIPVAYCVGHFRGWASAQKDINEKTNFDNE
jgi:lipopolysaccharide biosynthesis regulator YciM